MRVLSLIFVFFIAILTMNGQSSAEYISSEIKKVEQFLQKQDSKLSLSNDQKSKLTTIFEEKQKRQDLILGKKLSKVDTSNEITYLENEFKDKIENILSTDQRIAYQKIKKTKPFEKSSVN